MRNLVAVITVLSVVALPSAASAHKHHKHPVGHHRHHHIARRADVASEAEWLVYGEPTPEEAREIEEGMSEWATPEGNEPAGEEASEYIWPAD